MLEKITWMAGIYSIVIGSFTVSLKTMGEKFMGRIVPKGSSLSLLLMTEVIKSLTHNRWRLKTDFCLPTSHFRI